MSLTRHTIWADCCARNFCQDQVDRVTHREIVVRTEGQPMNIYMDPSIDEITLIQDGYRRANMNYTGCELMVCNNPYDPCHHNPCDT